MLFFSSRVKKSCFSPDLGQVCFSCRQVLHVGELLKTEWKYFFFQMTNVPFYFASHINYKPAST